MGHWYPGSAMRQADGSLLTMEIPRFDGVSAGAENEMAPWGQAGRQSPSPSQTFSRTSSALPSTSSMAPS